MKLTLKPYNHQKVNSPVILMKSVIIAYALQRYYEIYLTTRPTARGDSEKKYTYGLQFQNLPEIYLTRLNQGRRVQMRRRRATSCSIISAGT